MAGYVLPEDDKYHFRNLSKLTDDEFQLVRPPPITPGAPLEECVVANERARHMIQAIRARRTMAQAKVVK